MRWFKREPKIFCFAGNWISNIQKVRLMEGQTIGAESGFPCDNPPRVEIYDIDYSISLFKGNSAEQVLDELLRIGIYSKSKHQHAVIALRSMQIEFEEMIARRDNVTPLHAVS